MDRYKSLRIIGGLDASKELNGRSAFVVGFKWPLSRGAKFVIQTFPFYYSTTTNNNIIYPSFTSTSIHPPPLPFFTTTKES